MADSGSPITILSDVTFDRLWSGKQLHRSDVNPKAFGEFDIAMKGFFMDILDFKSRCINTKIYVAERGRDILGWQDQKDIGIIKGFEYQIKLKKDAVPVKQKLRPVPFSVRQDLKTLLHEMCEQGIITPVDSSKWISAIVLAKKKGGSIRLCVDLRALNRNILVDAHPLPRINDLLANLGKSRGRDPVTDLRPTWLDDVTGLSADSVDLRQVRMRVRGKQEKSKDYFDRVKSVKDLEVEPGDWALVKKPMKINKGDSKFSQPVKVEKISRRAVCLQGKGWWNKNAVVKITSEQADIIKKTLGDVPLHDNFECDFWDVVYDKETHNRDFGSPLTDCSIVQRNVVDSSVNKNVNRTCRVRNAPVRFKDFVRY
ncbi:hypothetical protein NDU88_002115 [Pleurodeles waltl]|uniref:Reverse transcriptase n=1 Tax=Pleurodeles waltl TaxID=8319 RepID=A0AAV7W0Y6_PLEWA|nr:hypothetical protein NDU88_002115 [Pleurodeles waltl]